MQIERLRIHNLRVVADLEIAPDRSLNLIAGPNGAGKTSILEAVYLAGRGRAFRHRDIRPLVTQGAQDAHVYVEVNDAGGALTRIGLGWKAGQMEARRDGASVRRRSELMHALPLQLITARSHELIERGPDARRRFLDLGLFHVKQGYQGLLSEYGNVLRQRNASLRLDDGTVHAFDPALIRLSSEIDSARQAYLERLLPHLRMLLQVLYKDWPVDLQYRPGWRGSDDLADALKRHGARDIKMKHTTCGAHRAGLDVRVNGHSAENHLSRGQQKILVYALLLAQARIQFEELAVWPVLLIDDLLAELDDNSGELVLRYLLESGGQCLATSTRWDRNWESRATVFHVEHGRLLTADNP